MTAAPDVVVIGAGPAGAIAAHGLAKRGAAVLLVEKAKFPREKVCGCCVNERALAVLDRSGVGAAVRRAASEPLSELCVGDAKYEAALPLPGGVAISRGRLDALLVEAAREAGAVVRDRCGARLRRDGAAWSVEVGDALLHPRCVVVADGLGGRTLDGIAGFESAIRADGRLGCGCILEPDARIAPGVIHMACGAGGYVGAVRLEDGRVDVAAALDVTFAQAHGGPAGAAAAIATAARWPWAGALAEAAWRGAPRLTRRRERVAGDGLFVVGDAAGYVEPFTGEGIAWAVAGGEAVVHPVVQALSGQVGQASLLWAARHRAVVRRRQRLCRAVAWTLRRPRLTGAALAVLSRRPALVAPLLRRSLSPLEAA